MSKSALAMLLGAASLTVITFSAAVHAGSEFSSGSMMGGGMMDRSMMEGGGMMSRMPRMMGGCSATMRGGSHGGHPNEQWRDERSTPDRGR